MRKILFQNRRHGNKWELAILCTCQCAYSNVAIIWITIGVEASRRGNGMSKVVDLHKKWSEDPENRKAYDLLGPEVGLSRALIEVRTRANLTQAELAQRMNTMQSVVARPAASEGGKYNSARSKFSKHLFVVLGSLRLIQIELGN